MDSFRSRNVLKKRENLNEFSNFIKRDPFQKDLKVLQPTFLRSDEKVFKDEHLNKYG